MVCLFVSFNVSPFPSRNCLGRFIWNVALPRLSARLPAGYAEDLNGPSDGVNENKSKPFTFPSTEMS